MTGDTGRVKTQSRLKQGADITKEEGTRDNRKASEKSVNTRNRAVNMKIVSSKDSTTIDKNTTHGHSCEIIRSIGRIVNQSSALQANQQATIAVQSNRLGKNLLTRRSK